MKRKLLSGALLLGSIIAANAQSSCVDAIALPLGLTTVNAPSGEYYAGGCWTVPTTGSDATAAEWYSYTADQSGVLRVNTNLSQNDGGDTRIAVYNGTCDALTCWYSGDDVYYNTATDPNNNYLTDIQFPVVAGTTYYITFDNIWSADGFDVSTEFYAPDCAAAAVPYTENWDPSTSYWFCWGKEDGNTDDNTFSLLTDYNFGGADVNPDYAVAIFSNTTDNDDYLVSPSLALTAGTSYTLSVVYNGVNVSATNTANESFQVLVADSANAYQLGDDVTNVTQNGTFATVKDNATTGTFEYTPDADGDYAFAIHSTSASGGGVLAIFSMSVTETASAAQNAQSAFSVFPNPANNVVNVANAKAQISAINLVDINGRTVKSAKFDGVSSAQVSIADLANGVYMMNIKSDKGTITKKVVKN